MVERIHELIEILNKQRDLYYNESRPDMSDAEYDALFEELADIEVKAGLFMSNSPTQSVGYEVKSKLTKLTHEYPMLSLDKTKSVDKIIDFFGHKEGLGMLKMDGLTIALTYEDGLLVRAETRGNGAIGEDVIHTVKTFINVPLTIPYQEKLVVFGEAVITYDDFDRINNSLPSGEEKYKNPRNLVSGSVRQLNNKITKERNVQFVAWRMVEGFNDTQSFSARLSTLSELGFTVVPCIYIGRNDTKELIEKDIELMKKKADALKYPIDGLVFSFNDSAYIDYLGATTHHLRGQIAFKFKEDEEVTTLRAIEWGMGKTAALTPVAIFDPVELAGTTVERATLHNISVMKDLHIAIGSQVTVKKSNEIIPMIVDCDADAFNVDVPEKCPFCGAPTQIKKDKDSEMLVCTNQNCIGRLVKTIVHAASRDALNIDGLSEATIQFLVDNEWIHNVKELYHLGQYQKHWSAHSGFGKRSVEKILDSIEKSRDTDLQRFLYSLNIPQVGRTASKEINKICEGDFDYFISHIASVCNTLLNTSGYGPAIANAINDFFKDNYDNVVSLAKEFNFKKEDKTVWTSLDGITFVVTGTVNVFKNRKELQQFIEDRGGKVAGAVSKNTNYLINNDTESSSSKNVSAKKLGVPIISEQQFMQLFGAV